jgi:hypothetical protein
MESISDFEAFIHFLMNFGLSSKAGSGFESGTFTSDQYCGSETTYSFRFRIRKTIS